jgi:hypothetical protein
MAAGWELLVAGGGCRGAVGLEVAVGGSELAFGQRLVAEPGGGWGFGLALRVDVEASHRNGDAGGEPVLVVVAGGDGGLDVAEEEGAVGRVEVGGEGEEASPEGEGGAVGVGGR